jgi:hypothetical protein
MKTQLNNTRNRIFLILALAGLLLTAVACTTPTETTTTAPEPATVEPTAVVADTASQPEAEPIAETETETEPEAEMETAVAEPTTTAPDAPAAAMSTDGLTDDEIADLLFMREEEKLARDVYLALYDVWGMNVFQNIAASEQTHTDSVLGLLTTYGLTDPVGDNAPGVFANADLQALYNDLVATGSQSLADALRVGAAIEEIDILDLDEAIARTQPADIIQVYQSLRAGSENHLRAFTSTLEQQTGETYQPQYLAAELYDAILSGTQSQGNGNAGSNGNGGNGKRNGRSNNS